MTGVKRCGFIRRSMLKLGARMRVAAAWLITLVRDGQWMTTRRCALTVLPVLTVLLVSCTSTQEAITAGDTSGAAEVPGATCDAEVTPIPEPAREINLVLDESGSMFRDEVGPITLWSMAKYSLEVFAALLSPNDELNVYRLSDYGPNKSGPTLTLSGSLPVTDRVAQVHDLELMAGSTPWRAVTAAAADLESSDAPEKWLVVATDGEFDSPDRAGTTVPAQEVESYMDALTAQTGARVAFMSIGDGAAEITPGEQRDVIRVKNGTELLEGMTTFANTIFDRSVVSLGDGSEPWSIDVPMTEVVAFAQGPDVSVGPIESSAGPIEPAESVEVAWAEGGNFIVTKPDGSREPFTPEPDRTLEGVLARYESIPAGEVALSATNATQVDVFYKPNVEFGYTITNSAGVDVGNVLLAGEPYVLDYGFRDSNCNPVESDLLAPVEYSADILAGEEVERAGLAPGSAIELPRNAYTLNVSAVYRGGSAAAAIPLIVNASSGKDLFASQMEEFPPPEEGLGFTYSIMQGNGDDRLPTSEEWASFDPSAVRIESSGNLEYQLLKNTAIGSVTLLVRAPGGDVYAADTGLIDVTLYPPSEGGRAASAEFTVIDDISGFDRFMHWFWTVGIWILVAIALLILLLGYLLKKRFPRRLKKRPAIEGIPRVIGQQRLNARGQFEVNGFRRLLPFVADTGTLKYVPPGTMGFRPMQVKAGPRKMLRLTNWKEIAKQSNVQVNGSPLDETTMKEPMFGASAMITADTPQMSFEMTPSQ
jgi:hypothetical protein